MHEGQIDVVIGGAGYAGMLATLRIAGKTHRQQVRITLVNAADTFIERPRLHQVAANRPVEHRPIAALLRDTGVRFVPGIITSLNPRRRELVVESSDGSQLLNYDYFLYALGSTINADAVPGVREHAYTLTPTGSHSAQALRTALVTLSAAGGRVLVVGGGATGIESAAEFTESYPNLHIVLVTHGELGTFRAGKIQTYMVASLRRLGVAIREHTTVTRLNAGEAITAAGDSIPFDLCLWAGGFAVPPLAREAGLAVNERGQVLIDPTMRSVSHPEIYAAGDCASPVQLPGAPVRMAAYTATIMGAHAADCLSNALAGRPQQPLSFAYAGQGIALGQHDAIGFSNYPDDRPSGPVFTGRPAAQIREFFVNFLAGLPGLERRWPGIFFWLGKGRARAAVTSSRPQAGQTGVSV